MNFDCETYRHLIGQISISTCSMSIFKPGIEILSNVISFAIVSCQINQLNKSQ